MAADQASGANSSASHGSAACIDFAPILGTPNLRAAGPQRQAHTPVRPELFRNVFSPCLRAAMCLGMAGLRPRPACWQPSKASEPLVKLLILLLAVALAAYLLAAVWWPERF
ncbi:MAG: potassium-transporting ATPase subunit F [Xanthomonadales bacterium PRO6]|nr:potassium-transporting ATPase subunit F [Xanthomonadales bacterium PRO6]